MRLFDLEFVNPEKPWEEQSYITAHHSNMWIKVTEAFK
jgi:hypothetical protein